MGLTRLILGLPGKTRNFAAKAAMDALAVSYAAELNRWSIETSIIVPGAFTSGTNHFAHAVTQNPKSWTS
jgi:NAD(P)-dependent dehydrogenase (short-subunit alcohol dehydrogenase family)